MRTPGTLWMLVLLMTFACSSGEDQNQPEIDACGEDLRGSDSVDVVTGEDVTELPDLVPVDGKEETTQDVQTELDLTELPPCDESLPAVACGLPSALPFEFVREDLGTPLSETEIAEFTRGITGLWKQIDYFNWLLETNHGVDASTGYPEYLIWWHDVDAVKSGDTVTFRMNSNYGGSHNNAEPTGLALSQCIAGYLLTGDPTAGELVRLFALSYTAMMKGFMFDENDPNPYIMARNIVPWNHEFTLPSGKKKAVDYTDWYFSYTGWNAERFHYPDNPTWGDIWVTTMRSKDDFPYFFRPTAWYPYVLAQTKDPDIYAAVLEAWEYMQGFCQDILDSGYYVRSKDDQGNPVIPEEDLASFVDYIGIFPDAECDARLSIDLIASENLPSYDCGSGQGSPYDDIAGGINYYNYSIVDGFHQNALHLALIRGHNDTALELLKGLVTRIERYENPETCSPGCEDESWGRDLATLLLQAAALGMPLTSDEARQVQHYYAAAVELYSQFPNWDLWNESVPDGTYDFRQGFHPAHVPEAVRVEEIAFLLEYCWSPFKNPAGAKFVDCDVVADMSRWGE